MPLLPATNSADRQLIGRSDYFGSMPEFALTGKNDTVFRARIGIYERRRVRYDHPGSRGYDEPQKCLRRFFGLQIQQFNESDSEAVQTVMSEEGEKIYAFDRMVRLFTISGFIFDTDRDLEDPDTGATIPGMHGAREWSEFYEEARISQLAKSGRIVKLTIQDQVITGAFVSSTRASDASDPHKINIIAQFLAINVRFHRLGKQILQTIPGTDVQGRLTAEGAASVGLLNRLVVDPRPDQLFASRLPPASTVPGIVLRGPTSFQESASITRPEST